jgi:hypothetical protein
MHVPPFDLPFMVDLLMDWKVILFPGEKCFSTGCLHKFSHFSSVKNYENGEQG